MLGICVDVEKKASRLLRGRIDGLIRPPKRNSGRPHLANRPAPSVVTFQWRCILPWRLQVDPMDTEMVGGAKGSRRSAAQLGPSSLAQLRFRAIRAIVLFRRPG